MKTKKSKVLIMLSIAVIFFISSNSSYCDAYSVKYKTTTNSQEKETINESYNSRKVAYITIKNVPISTAIKITVFKSVIIRNCDKNELSPIL